MKGFRLSIVSWITTFYSSKQERKFLMKSTLCIATLIMAILATPACANNNNAASKNLQQADTDTARQNLQQADANGDKALNYDEFMTFINLNAADNIGRAKMVKSRHLYSRAFSRLDKNGDGLITADEIER